MDFIGTTIEGMEEAAIKETSGKLLIPGRIIFKYDKNKEYLTLDKIYQIISKYKFSSLEDLKKQIKNIEIKGTFKCQCTRSGTHKFNSIMAEQEIGKSIQNNDLKYDKNPDNMIIIDIIQNQCILGILIKKDLAKRKYRLKLHKQTTHPLLASSLIKILNIKSKDSLLVLETKDGVIPIEASLQGIENITSLDKEENNTRNAKVNAKLAKASISFESEIPKEIDFIITQMIFSNKRKEPNKIQETFQISKKILKKKLAIITNHPNELKTNIKIERELIAKVGKSELNIIIYKNN